MSEPLAYFITFHTYGTWLHGRKEGAIDYRHRAYGQAHLRENSSQEASNRRLMKGDTVLLDKPRREAILSSIPETCSHRGWVPHAIHIRRNHIHAIITAVGVRPEKVLTDLKAYATRRLRKDRLVTPNTPVWSEHGSTRYLWEEQTVDEKINYTLYEQGEPMAAWSAKEHGASIEHEA